MTYRISFESKGLPLPLLREFVLLDPPHPKAFLKNDEGPVDETGPFFIP